MAYKCIQMLIEWPFFPLHLYFFLFGECFIKMYICTIAKTFSGGGFDQCDKNKWVINLQREGLPLNRGQEFLLRNLDLLSNLFKAYDSSSKNDWDDFKINVIRIWSWSIITLEVRIKWPNVHKRIKHTHYFYYYLVAFIQDAYLLI